MALIAIGIGAGAAVLSVEETAVLKPLPYAAPDRLVLVREKAPSWDTLYGSLPANLSHYFAWRESGTSFDGLAAMKPVMFVLGRDDGSSEQVQGARVSANFFSVLGVRIAIGRNFTDDEEAPGRDAVVVLTDRMWRRAYNAESNIVGRLIGINGTSFTVVGVLAPDFRFPKNDQLGSFIPLGNETDIFKPLGSKVGSAPPAGNHDYAVIGRLKQATSLGVATADLNRLQARLSLDQGAERDLGILVVGLAEHVAGLDRRTLRVLLFSVVAALLAICSTLSMLLLARIMGATDEIALLQVCGATMLDIMWQYICASLLIAYAGCVTGLVIASWTVRTVVQRAPFTLPFVADAHLDGWVVLSAIIISSVMACLVVVIPLAYLRKVAPGSLLGASPRISSGLGARRARSALITTNVAAGTVVLAVTLALVLHVSDLIATNTPLDRSDVVTVSITLPQYRYRNSEQRSALYRRLLASLQGAQQIRHVGITSTLPLEGEANVDSVSVPGDVRPDDEKLLANFRYVSAGFFEAVGIAAQDGSLFSRDEPLLPSDAAIDASVLKCELCGSAPSGLVLSQSVATALWPGQSAIGRHVVAGNATAPAVVIGVVADTRTTSDGAGVPVVYAPYWSSSPVAGSIVARVQGSPAAAMSAIRQVIRQTDPTIPITRSATMHDVVVTSMASRRFGAALLAWFSVIALVVEASGIYAAISYVARRQKRPLGMRLALGATRRSVFTFVTKQGVIPSVVGLLIGSFLFWVCAYVIGTLLPGVSMTRSSVLIGVCVLQLTISVLSCAVPARTVCRCNLSALLRQG